MDARSLQHYRKKRNFGATREPLGRKAKATDRYRYVIQKHDASRLHYDFRLELAGTMKSWAVTRGPSLVTGEKRLAIHVEDHPIEYADFEGTIPKGQYGGGTVMIWDRGHWHPEGDPHEGYKKGHLDFTLDGEKLKGRWHLVRMRRRTEKQDAWLLIKGNDEAARTPGAKDVLEEMPLSAATGRSLTEIAEGRARKPAKKIDRKREGAARRAHRANAKAAKPRGELPDFIPPALATLHREAPDGEGWLHEVKFDGYRIEARLDHGKVRLFTRKELDWASKFSPIAAAVAELHAETALLDGELVVEDERGASSFAALQASLKEGHQDRLVYYAFDLLFLDGHNLAARPLIERKAALAHLLSGTKRRGPVRLSEHFEEPGPLVLRHACGEKLEGIVSKLKDSPYVGGRSERWIKSKCSNRQELVVVGYATSSAEPRAIGALVVGYYDRARLRYAGRIGTGYSRDTAKELWRQLQPMRRDRSPIDPAPAQETRRRTASQPVVWVEPRLVIEADFRSWTSDHLVRQAVFQGVREDKSAREVTRETPARTAAASRPAAVRKTAAAGAGRPQPARSGGRPARGAGAVRLTHPDRTYWADVGITKQDLADYYRAVWDYAAPQIVGRPLALVRCPEGTAGQCFFQKHASAGLANANLRTVVDNNGRQVLAVDDLDGALSLVQSGALELHVRGSMIDRLDVCDRIVFDLDPGKGVTWPAMLAAAGAVRERLDALKLASFVKLSGGKGLHIVVPHEGTDWASAKAFAEGIARSLAADEPERYVAKLTKSLRTGKVFVDYLRNSLEQTSVAAYSTRARGGAPISIPVSWQELGRTKAGNQFTVRDVTKRLNALKVDPWKDIDRVHQSLPQSPPSTPRARARGRKR